MTAPDVALLAYLMLLWPVGAWFLLFRAAAAPVSTRRILASIYAAAALGVAPTAAWVAITR